MATTWRRFYRADADATVLLLASDAREKKVARLSYFALGLSSCTLALRYLRKDGCSRSITGFFNVDMDLLLAHKLPMETDIMLIETDLLSSSMFAGYVSFAAKC